MDSPPPPLLTDTLSVSLFVGMEVLSWARGWIRWGQASRSSEESKRMGLQLTDLLDYPYIQIVYLVNYEIFSKLCLLWLIWSHHISHLCCDYDSHCAGYYIVNICLISVLRNVQYSSLVLKVDFPHLIYSTSNIIMCMLYVGTVALFYKT